MEENAILRFETNCFWSSVDTFKEYTELVDIFKYSGRLRASVPQGSGNLQMGWLFRERAAVSSFSEVIENKLEPVHLWVFGTGIFPSLKTDIKDIKEGLKDNFGMTEEGKILEQRLKNCKNQCYKCHLCERTFGISDIDSIMEL